MINHGCYRLISLVHELIQLILSFMVDRPLDLVRSAFAPPWQWQRSPGHPCPPYGASHHPQLGNGCHLETTNHVGNLRSVRWLVERQMSQPKTSFFVDQCCRRPIQPAWHGERFQEWFRVIAATWNSKHCKYLIADGIKTFWGELLMFLGDTQFLSSHNF